MQIETITFGQAEIRSADDRRTIRHSSADDLPLVRRRSAAHLQRVFNSVRNYGGCDTSSLTEELEFLSTRQFWHLLALGPRDEALPGSPPLLDSIPRTVAQVLQREFSGKDSTAVSPEWEFDGKAVDVQIEQQRKQNGILGDREHYRSTSSILPSLLRV
ncbi:hypothetical protein B0H13DRAFT_1915504 [Mycena leptocephala]|nr:hypothetical protein B0H13DRAFT_1915504 [Mycena leptocephala]